MTKLLDPERFAPINAALEQLLQLDGQERVAATDQWCAAHPELAAQLRELLRLSDDDRTLFAGLAVEALVPTFGAVGERLGDWVLKAPLGRGGSGEVWLAEGFGDHRDQRAAVKRALETTSRPRFERERRYLAQLSDAGVARLIDSGIDASGRPWFAMEYVDGERIDTWCDARRLSIPARVALLGQVARSVHEAHRALLVHRDLKPTNVLVTGTDRPQVKLVDFGIAKDLSADDAPTLDTMLTPQYASPEQLGGGAITIASDIFQLGLLTHELLCGGRPMASFVRSGRLPPMASVAAELGDSVALARQTSIGALQHELSGDVQAIVDLATNPEPDARYASALKMAEDLDALLRGLPVFARFGGWRYRAARFVRRHRSSVALLLILVVVSGVYTANHLTQARRMAQQSSDHVAVRETLMALMKQADPMYSGRPDVDVSPWLDEAVVLARKDLHDQPVLLAEVLHLAANAKMRHARFAEAEPLLREALRHADGSQQFVIEGRLGEVMHYQARYTDAANHLESAMRQWQKAPEGFNLPRAYFDVLHSRGDYVKARTVLESMRSAPGSFSAAIQLRDLGVLARDSAAPIEATQLLQESLALLEQLGADDLSKATVRVALARALVMQGQSTRARTFVNAALPAIRRTYGDHQAVPGMARHVLAVADFVDGKDADADKALTEVLDRDYAGVLPGNVLIAYARLDRAHVRARLGHVTAALEDLNIAEGIFVSINTPPHPRASEALVLRARIELMRDPGGDVSGLVERAVALRQARFGPDHALTQEAERWVIDLQGLRDAEASVASWPYPSPAD